MFFRPMNRALRVANTIRCSITTSRSRAAAAQESRPDAIGILPTRQFEQQLPVVVLACIRQKPLPDVVANKTVGRR